MDTLIAVYSHKDIVSEIFKASELIRYRIPDQTNFEERVMDKVGKYLLLDEKNSRNMRYIKRLIYREYHYYISDGNRKLEESVFYSEVNTGDGHESPGEHKEIEFEPADVLANVESEVIAKEMTALLAKGDQRKKEILGFWAIGNNNNAYISRSLARSFGGNKESHRKAINRFREECRDFITAAI